MTLHHVRQPADSRCCGQACVATLCGVTLDEAIKVFGHEHGTTTREVDEAIMELGGWCEGRLNRKGSLWSPLEGEAWMLKLTWPRFSHEAKRRGESHWTLVHGGIMYDPALDRVNYWHLYNWRCYVTSAMEVRVVL